MRSRSFGLLLTFSVLFVPCLFAQDIPTPEQFFGHRMGAEGEIIDYMRSLEYYRLLADGSNRILYEELGKTTDGNPFVLLVISSPGNIADLDRLRAERERLSDPRNISEEEARRLASELPAVAVHTGSIHTTEISCVQVLPELVHMLVSGESPEVKRILDNTIVLVIACANPDGQVMIKKWYEEHRGKEWEGNMPWLYHSYVGHDDNRDWILLHFPETRLVAAKVFNTWHPVYSLEMHQMGPTGARIFVPPYIDPHDANTAPQVLETMSMVGMAMSHRLTAEGKGGVVKNAIFDLYTPARAYQVNHGTGRILTETASADFAGTRIVKPEELEQGRSSDYYVTESSWNFPMPWPGGEWKFRDMVEYQLSANLAALELVATHRAVFNLAYYQALKRACDGEGRPYAYVLPAEQRDPGSTSALIRALQRGAVEVHRARGPFKAGGRSFPAGSHVIVLRQSYSAWAKTLLEVQEYPDLRRSPQDPPPTPYDMTAHTLPLLMGVEVVRIEGPFEADLELLSEPSAASGRVEGAGAKGFAVPPENNDAYWLVDELLDSGYQVRRLRRAAKSDGIELPAGTFIIAPDRRLQELLRSSASGRSFVALGIERGLEGAETVRLGNPRVGIYEPWGGSIDAGWTRLVLEQWELEYTVLRNADFRRGGLEERFDVIIFSDGMRASSIVNGNDDWPEEYTGGIEKRGVEALRAFAEAGGTVVACGRTSMAVAELLELPVVDKLQGLRSQEFFCPGSILLMQLDVRSPLSYGSPEKIAAMVSWGPAFVPAATTEPGLQLAARYPDYNPLMSGYLIGPEKLYGAGTIAVQPVGRGRVILFAFRPQFRAMTDGTYKLLFNAVFWAAEVR
jgi:hypothetical protein